MVACKDKTADQPKRTDTPTTGSTHIWVDEAFQPMLSQQLSAFHIRYVKAKITPTYTNEREILKRLFNQSIELAVLGRKFTDNELAAFKQARLQALVAPAFYDAVALVANANSGATALSTDELKKTLQSTDGAQPIYLDHTASGTVRFLQEEGYIGKKIVAEVAGSPEKVLMRVATNPNALGLVPMNWVSDKVGLAQKPYGNKIKILGLKTNKGVVLPTQKSLSEGIYPLRRACYVIDISGRGGLARGFSAFATTQIGQLVVLKSGLLPADIPETVINLVD